MFVLRVVVATVLAAFFALTSAANIIGTVRAVRGGPNFSRVPLFGGVAGVLACAIAPLPGLIRWAWVPLLIDPGCALLALEMVAFVVRRR